MNANQLRKDTYNFLKKFGSKKTFLSEAIGVSPTTLNLWLRSDREMAEHRLKKLAEIISQ